MVLTIAGIAFKLGLPFQIWCSMFIMVRPCPLPLFYRFLQKLPDFYSLELGERAIFRAVNFLLPLLGFVATIDSSVTWPLGQVPLQGTSSQNARSFRSGTRGLLVGCHTRPPCGFPRDSESRCLGTELFYMFVYCIAAFPVACGCEPCRSSR